MILTRLDLSDDENLRDCRAELNRALDISTLSPDGQMQQLGAFALWGAKWGEAMVAELETPTRDEDEDDLIAASALAPVRHAVEAEIERIEKQMATLDDGTVEILQTIIENLDKAIAE